MKKILRTILPFYPKIRIIGEEVSTELLQQIRKMAKFYGKNEKDFSAIFKLSPTPNKHGFYLASEVIYEKGKLKKSKKLKEVEVKD